MTPDVEQVINQIRALSSEEQQQLWQVVKDEMRTAEQIARAAAAKRASGEYKDMPFSADEFLALKHDDDAVEREDRRDRIRKFRTKHQGMFSSIAEFMASKHEEAER